MTADPLLLALRAAGCVFAEEEADRIRQVRGPGDHLDVAAGRADGIPLEHLLGVARFAGLDLAVAPGVFIPRVRAELLVQVAAGFPQAGGVVVDLGCGCGALAAAMTRRAGPRETLGVEVDPAAVEVARRNGRAFGFEVAQGSWWQGLPSRLRGRVDLAVCYLPHVPSARVRQIHPDLRSAEPRTTVDGGPDGLAGLREVLAGAARWLAPDGVVVTLLAEEQVPSARKLGWPLVVAVEEDGDVAVIVRRR